ncbi:MAG: transcription termination factor NusA [Candidatus Aminicenantes bacterium]|nr:transcription termination factor NusA [Candidatus Aminicenantes bacterium]
MEKENIIEAIESLAKEKGIDRDYLIEAIEEALKAASQKYFGEGERIEANFDREKGEIKVHVKKRVVNRVEDPTKEIHIEQAKKMFGDVKEGDEVEISLPPETLGRLAAQAAKSVLFNKVKEAEEERVFNEYKDLEGEIISARIHRVTDDDVYLLIGKDEALLPKKEQVPEEKYNPGKEMKFLVLRVLRESKPVQIIVSRSRPEFVGKLLEREIPELKEGKVKIKKIVREPGIRSKVAVYSEDPNVDALGSCIGMKGNRVLSVTKELSGERIDIIQWDEDIEKFIANSLSPARVKNVQILDKERKIAEVVVPDDSYSVAVGRKGTNIRLASWLTRWKIILKAESEKREEILKEVDERLPFEEFPKPFALALKKRKIFTWSQLKDLSLKEISRLPGITGKFLNRIKEELEVRGYRLRR